MIRLAHVWSADLGMLLSLHHVEPLIAAGWEVYAICPPGPRVREFERAGVKWLPHPMERKLLARSDPAALASMYRTMREHQFHIVHTHNAKVGILARVVAKAARVPVIMHTHNGLIYSLDSKLTARVGIAAMERVASEVSDRIFVQSEDDYQTLVKTGGANPRVLDLVGNGIDMTRFDPSRFSADQRRACRASMGVYDDDDVLFFSAGRLVREKGFVELFDAYAEARAKNPKVRLAIAGPDDTERGLGLDRETVARATANGLMLLGERSDMPNLYSASDVVILPSWREGIARVLMEGAAMGKPLCASDGRGCRTVVRPGWGLLTKLKDASSIRDAMLELASSAELRARIGAHNREGALREYDVKRIVQRVAQAYIEKLQERGISDSSFEAFRM